MSTSTQVEPDWLVAWMTKSTTLREALDRFDSLPGAGPSGLAGLWRGRTLPTGHPLDGLLEALGWYGKAVLTNGLVHPLLFRWPSGRLVALDPAWMPAGVALRWPALARSPVAQTAFQALGPLLRARGPAARIEAREFRGRRGAALVYDRQPIVDHLRYAGADRLVGLMERRGMRVPYFFLLWRETAAQSPFCGPMNEIVPPVSAYVMLVMRLSPVGARMLPKCAEAPPAGVRRSAGPKTW